MFNDITNSGAPIAANQAVAQAGAVFQWAIRNEIADLPGNPAHGIDHNGTRSRERVLSADEVPLFWAAFDEAGLVRSRALQMIMLTGQRPGEVSHMRRSDVAIGWHTLTDENQEQYTVDGGWWQLPGQPQGQWPGTKNGQTHQVWLAPAAVAILEELDEGKQGFVFRGRGDKPVQGLDAAMRAVCKSLGAARATPHDLRRTAGTMVTSLGFTRDQMNRLQNHVDGGIGSVYDRHGYAHENRVIQEAVASRVMALVGGGSGGNVLAMQGAAQ
jgi:integrase